MFNPVVDYLGMEIEAGRRVGVFSCEDPLNTPFHRDLLQLGDYLHLKTSIAAAVDLATVDLGMRHKQIASWMVVGHTDGLRVCGAIQLIMNGYAEEPENLRKTLERIERDSRFESSLEGNVVQFVRRQCEKLQRHISGSGREGAVPVQGGIIRYVGPGYVSELI